MVLSQGKKRKHGRIPNSKNSRFISTGCLVLSLAFASFNRNWWSNHYLRKKKGEEKRQQREGEKRVIEKRKKTGGYNPERAQFDRCRYSTESISNTQHDFPHNPPPPPPSSSYASFEFLENRKCNQTTFFFNCVFYSIA